jgi:hypothetical protein
MKVAVEDEVSQIHSCQERERAFQCEAIVHTCVIFELLQDLQDFPSEI